MTKSKLNGNKNGLGLYELMTAPEEVYRKVLAAAERNNIEEFCELLGIDKSRRRVKNEDY
jgi:hypothetical protein